MEEKKTILTDEQVDKIVKELDEEIKGTSLEEIAKLPSNQGKEERSKLEIANEKGIYKQMMVTVDPNTGENKIIGPASEEVKETYDDMCEKIENSDIEFKSSDITAEDINNFLNQDQEDNILSELSIDKNYSLEDISQLLNIINRKNNKEDFSVYKELPEVFKNKINEYVEKSGLPLNTVNGKQFRNTVAEMVISEIVSDISINKIQDDFGKEIEDLFQKGSAELASTIIGYTSERNKSYREYANNMEDEEKKEKLLSILDQIDLAYSLENLIEFAKKTKIKKFELEKPNKVFDNFLKKYEESQYNIYGIYSSRPILFRQLNWMSSEEKYSQDDINAFFVLFCKYCLNMKPENPVDHAFMFYVMYNINITDINLNEETKEVSRTFINNVKKVIENIRQRNTYLNA